MCLTQEIVPLTQLPWFREAEDVYKQQTETWRTKPREQAVTTWDTEAGGSLNMEIVDPTWRPPFSPSQMHAE